MASVNTFENILYRVHIIGLQESSNIEKFEKNGKWPLDYYTLHANSTLAKYTELKFLVHKKMFQPYPDEASACDIINGVRAMRCTVVVGFSSKICSC